MTTTATADAPAVAPPAGHGAAAPVRHRIAALDVVRGIAVAGILMANVFVFFGLVFMPPDFASTVGISAADRVATVLMHVLVEGKFYSVFSLLFGIGFGVQLARGGDAALPRFRRRLRVLLVIGAVHAFLIWSGDILMLYALLGFTLPWFARRTDRELLRWTLLLLSIPSVLYLVSLAGYALLGPETPPPSNGAGIPPAILAIFGRTGTGGFVDGVIANLVMLAGRWMDLFVTMRFPKVLGMFVLGLWAVRTGIALDPAAHRATLRRWRDVGLGFGIPVNIVAVLANERWSYLPPSPGGALGVLLQAVGYPLLAVGYASAIALLVVDRARVVNVFAPVGRMALTNYLMHSVVCGVLARGSGFGLWWQVGAATAMGIALVIIVAQIPLSAWWLRHHRFGPAERVWRRFTYGTTP